MFGGKTENWFKSLSESEGSVCRGQFVSRLSMRNSINFDLMSMLTMEKRSRKKAQHVKCQLIAFMLRAGKLRDNFISLSRKIHHHKNHN